MEIALVWKPIRRDEFEDGCSPNRTALRSFGELH